ncbi:MAG TPA: putative Ig domain-containing protein [Candidatus Dormibacteraeota bacterium]|nr:putative Ig domain-containing protein [Candidatus Dormibacteraeota bacterium]
MSRRAAFCLASIIAIACLAVAGCNGNPSNYSHVLLSATATSVGPNQVVTITATVPADKTNAGVTWTFTPGAGAPTPPGTFSSTSTTATYTSPNPVAAKFTVVIQATSVALPSETNSITITVNPPQPLAVKTTSIPNGVQNTPYAATQLQSTGGVAPYTWSPASLPDGFSLSSSGVISGTPTQTGTFTLPVQVQDSEPTPMTATGNITVTVTNLLNGSYAFEFSGFNAGGQVVMAGTFTTDGVSKITAGVEDVNSISPTTPKTQTFTGTYTIGSDNRGQLVFSSLPGSPAYAFTIDAAGLHGRMIEFDSTGVRGSGEFSQQTTTKCAYNTLSGTGSAGNGWVIALSGSEGNISGSTPGPFVLAGRFTAETPANSSTPGTIDNAEVDVSAPGDRIITQDSTFSGTFQTSSQASRCAMSVTMTLSNMNFAVYPIASSNGVLTEAYVVETDTLSATTPYVSVGKLIHQTGYPFTLAYQSFNGSSVGSLSGSVIPNGQSAYVPFAGIARLADPSGGTAFTLSLVDNVAGTVRTDLGANAISTNFSSGDSYGRVNTILVDTDPLVPLLPVFYVISPNEALCLLEGVNTPALGLFEPQATGSGTTFSASTFAGAWIQGTAPASASTTPNLSGAIALANSSTTAGDVASLEDLSTTSANSPGLLAQGTYALTASGTTDGSGTMSFTQTPPPPPFNTSFFIVSPSKAVMVTTTSSDTNPVLIILGDQIDDFGVN